MKDSLLSLLSGTQVYARGLRWEIVGMLNQGEQTLVRLRGIEGGMLGKEMNFLYPLGGIQFRQHDFRSEMEA